MKTFICINIYDLKYHEYEQIYWLKEELFV